MDRMDFSKINNPW